VRGQRGREGRQGGKVRHRGPRDGQLAERTSRTEQVQRGGRAENQDRHPPAGQGRPGPGLVSRLHGARPQQIRRSQRPGRAGDRGQLQRDLAGGRLARRRTGRPGQRGQQAGQFGG